MIYRLPTYRKVLLVTFILFSALIWLVSVSTPMLAVSLTVITSILLVPLDYMINQQLIPLFYNKQKYLQFVFLVIILIVTLVGVQALVTPLIIKLFFPQSSIVSKGSNGLIDFSLLTTVFLSGFTTITSILTITNDLQNQRKKVVELERDQVRTELDFLKAQINPHFLFNALNTAYFQINQANWEARKTIMEVSEMLRYMLYETNAEFVRLDKELLYIKSYISIQQLRSKRIEVNAKLDEAKLSGKKIAPLLLIPFIENAFKHVSIKKERKNVIDIALSLQDRGILFRVYNTKEQQIDLRKEEGIGLANVKRRLELIYPNTHSLIINDMPESFEITLTLDKWL